VEIPKGGNLRKCDVAVSTENRAPKVADRKETNNANNQIKPTVVTSKRAAVISIPGG
jgi:hypothetical protein